MNRIIKGSIAGVAGTLLLMGGYGTFALWTEAEALDGDITSGQMDLTLGTSATWADTSGVGSVSIPEISAFRPVPGDEVTLTQPITVTMEGDNLAGTLALDTAALKAQVESTWGDDLDVSFRPVNKPEYVDSDNDGVYEFDDAAAASGSFNVEVVFSFDAQASNEAAQGGATVDLSTVALRLSQTRS